MKKNSKNKGYTIIETMVSVSLFVTIIIAGMGALLNANLIYNKSSNMRSIIDNLTFIMEDMSRTIRTGYNYRCITSASDYSNIDAPKSCQNGGAIAFEEASGGDPNDLTDQWVYKVESTDGGQTYNLSKSIDSGSTWTRLNTDEIRIDSISGFSVLGAEEPPGDTQQPIIFIKLSGEVKYKDLVTPFSLQTAVSQRLIDIKI